MVLSTSFISLLLMLPAQFCRRCLSTVAIWANCYFQLAYKKRRPMWAALFQFYLPAKSHLVALDAIFGFEGILAIVACSAGFTPLIHVAHLCLERTGLEGEDLGVAVGALVHA